MEISQNGRVILDRLAREIRQAEEIVGEPSNEIMFEDGHTERLQYIRYYLQDQNLKRQQIIYYFEADPSVLVRYDATDPDGNSPTEEIEKDELIAEKIENLQFNYLSLLSISLTLDSTVFETKIYPRNIK
jgi:hypothetical protein